LELFVKLKDGDSSTVSGFQENWKSVSVKVKNWLQSSKFIPDDQEFTPGMLCVQIRYICLIVFNGVVSLFKTKPKLYFIMWLTTFGLSLSSRLWVYEVFSDKINLKNDSVNYPEAFTSVSILMKHVFFFARWNLWIFPGTCHFSWKSVLSSSGEHVSSGMLSIILDIQWLESFFCNISTCNILNTRDSVWSGYPNTEKRVENTTRSGVFSMEFEVFG